MATDKSKVIWLVTDPTEKKRPVRLTEARRDHILKDHIELEPHIDSLSTIIESPKMILADADDIDTDLYCAQGYDLGEFGSLWLRIVVRFDISESGEVTTAYLTAEVPEGEIKWLPPKITD